MHTIIHRAEERGKGEHGWLTSRFSFSFAHWYEPTRMGFGALRVLNDDIIAPNSGFGMHPHRDMEIVTIVTGGTVTHRDDMGNTGTVPAGDVQAMSAGTGVVHSEYNASTDEPLTLFQLWIEPNAYGVAPRYAQKSFGFTDQAAGATLLVSPDGNAGSLSIHQDAYISHVVLDGGGRTYSLIEPGHGVYVFVVTGEVTVGDTMLSARDAIGVWNTHEVVMQASASATVLVIEVPLSER